MSTYIRFKSHNDGIIKYYETTTLHKAYSQTNQVEDFISFVVETKIEIILGI